MLFWGILIPFPLVYSMLIVDSPNYVFENLKNHCFFFSAIEVPTVLL